MRQQFERLRRYAYAAPLCRANENLTDANFVQLSALARVALSVNK